MAADGSFYGGEREGEPHRSRDNGPVGDVMTQSFGPLPVWGWATVLIGAVFLWRRMSGNKAAAAPVATTPAYPAGPDFGSVTNNYGSTAPSSPSGLLPTVKPTSSSGWGPDWPNTAPGVVPDRACRPGSVAIENFDTNYWTCMTPTQASSLFAWSAAHPASNPAPLPTTPPPGAAVNCPAGYSLVQAAGGLVCVPGVSGAGATALTGAAQ